MTEHKTNAHRCLLRNACPLAGDPAQCTSRCNLFVGLAGTTGTGARIAAANVPADYRNVTLEDSPARESQAAIYAKLADYVATFERQFDEDYAVSSPDKRIKSLYLYSEEPGTGKTTTAVSLLHRWITQHYIGSLQRGLTPLQRPGYMLDLNEWQTQFNLAVMTNDDDDMADFKRKLRIAMEVPFLVLDDVGVREITPKFRGYVHAIVNHRVSNALTTVYTSNIPIKHAGKKDRVLLSQGEVYDLVDVFGEKRLADRIGDLTMTLSFGGTSKRGTRR